MGKTKDFVIYGSAVVGAGALLMFAYYSMLVYLARHDLLPRSLYG